MTAPTRPKVEVVEVDGVPVRAGDSVRILGRRGTFTVTWLRCSAAGPVEVTAYGGARSRDGHPTGRQAFRTVTADRVVPVEEGVKR